MNGTTSRACLALLACITVSASASAQPTRAPFVCSGQAVSRVDINAERPPYGGYARRWLAVAHAMGLHHTTTRDDVVASFLSLAPGKACTEFRRAESERVLRAQPFLSDASVHVVPDTGGTVVVLVTTTDEIPVLVSGRLRGIRPEAFALGNENVFGSALRVVGRVEGGAAYRTAYGGLLEQDALFDRPYRLILQADRYRVGERLSAEMEHPFFTNLQRISWHAGFVTSDDYIRFERPAMDELALQSQEKSFDAGGVLRIFGESTVGLLGGAITGRRFDPSYNGIVVSDFGFKPDTGKTLQNRYGQFHVGRIGVIAGIRRVNFVQVNGFDALVGVQDVARGAQAGVYVAKGISAFGENDYFVSSAAYAGAANKNALLASLALGEIRRDPATGNWDSMIGSIRTAFYFGSAPGAVLIVDDQLSGGRDSRLPLQLSFRDPEGGLIAYRNSALAGAVRNVARAEVRWSGESVYRRADFGIAGFTEVGTLAAGDAPYGVNATRTSVGFSILSAYPTRSKRLYRADIAFPLTRSGSGAGGIEVRFSSLDRTQSFWREPSDVSRARTGIEPNRLFAWPTR